MNHLQPVDLSNLMDMTDNDENLLQELIDEFYSTSEDILKLLSANKKHEGEDREWERSAHALKGMSYNLGAHALGDLAKEAQEASAKSAHEKADVYERLVKEHLSVVAFLKAR